VARQQLLGVSALSNAISIFNTTAKAFMDETKKEGFLHDVKKVNSVNEKMKTFQRVWVNQAGLKGRPFYRNLAYAPDLNYGTLVFYSPLPFTGQCESWVEGNMMVLTYDIGYAPQTFPGFVEAWAAGNITAAAEEIKKLVQAVNMAVEILKGP
jgi:hypothetical protein